MPCLWQIARCFSHIQNFPLCFEEVAGLPSPNSTKSCYPKLHFLQRCVQNRKLVVCSFLCQCCKFGASLSWHNPQHILHFNQRLWDLICRILGNEVCDLTCLCHVVAKDTSSDIILHPPVQNNNPVRCAGRQLSHRNLNLPQIPLPVAPIWFKKNTLLIRTLHFWMVTRNFPNVTCMRARICATKRLAACGPRGRPPNMTRNFLLFLLGKSGKTLGSQLSG